MDVHTSHMRNLRLSISTEVRARITDWADAMDALPSTKQIARDAGLTPKQVTSIAEHHRRLKRLKAEDHYD